MNGKVLEPLFGNRINYSIDIYENIKREVSEKKKEYMYLSQEAFTQIGAVKGASWTNSCFTYETLQRLFLACVTGHFRMYKWIEGIEQGLAINNFLVFCSTTRGFMEAASDFYYLEDIPAQLIDRFEEFRMAIAGKKDKSIIDLQHIEESLLHFQEASRTNKDKGENYIPKTAKYYLEMTNLLPMDLYNNCYGELCEITHPAKRSLDVFLSENQYIYTIDIAKDKELITDFLSRHSHELSELFERAENLCFVCLRLINLFRVENLNLDCIEQINLSNLGIWKKISELQAY